MDQQNIGEGSLRKMKTGFGFKDHLNKYGAAQASTLANVYRDNKVTRLPMGTSFMSFQDHINHLYNHEMLIQYFDNDDIKGGQQM